MGIGLPFGERHRLAAEAANLLEPTDAARDLAHHRPLDFVPGRALGDIVRHDLVEPLLGLCRIHTGTHIKADVEHADPLKRAEAGARRNRELLLAHQDIVEP